MTISVGEATRPVHSKAARANPIHSASDAALNAGSHNSSTASSPAVLPLSESLEMRPSFSTRDEIAALLEEAHAALFVAKRGVRSSSMLDTPPLSISRPGHHGNRPRS